MTDTIYAISMGSGAHEFVCGDHLDEALQELRINDAILSWGEASSTYDCAWC